MAQNRLFTVVTLRSTIRIDHMIAYIEGLAKPCMSSHPMASPTVCLVSIKVNYLTVTGDCSCLVFLLLSHFTYQTKRGLADKPDRSTNQSEFGATLFDDTYSQ